MAKNTILENILPHDKKKQRADKIILKANEKSQKIITKAVQKANQILMQANLFHKNIRDLVKQQLEATVVKSADLYQKELNQALGKSLEEFRSIVNTEFTNSQKILLEGIEQERGKLKEELGDYKKARIAEIDKKLHEEVEKIAWRIIGEALPAVQKERLIIEALEQAKKNAVFDEI